MDQHVCYAFDRGLHQADVDRLESQLQGQSILEPGSPARLYRLMWNLYIDLYRNGWGAAYQILPACMEEFRRVSGRSGWSVPEGKTANAFSELFSFVDQHLKAYNTVYGDENEYLDEPVDQDDVEWPSAAHMYPHMECIMDFIIERVSQVSEPLRPVQLEGAVC